MTTKHAAPYREVDALLRQVLESVQDILASHFVGMYLDGSLGTGDFDEDSDIDFVVVTDEDISGDVFSALQAMHEPLAKVGSKWAVQLEGSYISLHALRRCDPAQASYPNIQRGKDERLKMVQPDEALVIHRHILREQGLTLAGPDPQTLIDPGSPTDLRRAMLKTLHGWAADILNDPTQIKARLSILYRPLAVSHLLHTAVRHNCLKARCGALGTGNSGRAVGGFDRARLGRTTPSRIRSIFGRRERNARAYPLCARTRSPARNDSG